jgi:DNA mismatch repair protein MutS2
MDEKTLTTLEYWKILDRLAEYSAFGLSADLARALRPTDNLDEAHRRLALTTEARRLLSINDDFNIGGARDVRSLVDLAGRSGVLEPTELLDVKNTLVAARTLLRTFEHQSEPFPNLGRIVNRLSPPGGIVDAISRAISERGDVLDNASDKLGHIRSELKVAHDRLLSRLERLINDPKNGPILQEPIITQRNGRYVVPLRAEFKGRMRSIVHDQSSSGATLFVEPLATVELNNQWHELQLAERDEVRRILVELSGVVGSHAPEIIDILEALGELDLALMCARYADDLRAAEPVLVLARKPRENHPGCTIRLFQARHPLLDLARVVPVDVDLDDRTFAVVITGPNTGGKTVTLKTVGLMALMAQSGLHIPAQSGSTISLFRNIYADIGDEQSIEQSLSTFSGHITNIVRILKLAWTDTLVLLDELGAGTDPQEGAALARALMDWLVKHRVPCMVATHYPELKAYAHSTPGVVNASMEFNLQTLRPTYHLTIGLPGRSNALLIAERLGLEKEILESARSEIDPNDLRAEDLLDEIHRQRDRARTARGEAEKSQREAVRLRAELAEKLEKIEDERLKVLDQARAQAEDEIANLRSELDSVRREMNRARQPLEAIKSLQERVESLEVTTQQPEERRNVTESEPQPLRVGERVRLRSLNMEGVITALGESDMEVQLGALRVRARPNDIDRRGTAAAVAAAAESAPEAVKASRRRKEVETPAAPEAALAGGASARSVPLATGPMRASPGMELDLRGQRAEDALAALDQYLENAYLSGMPFVRIIHGKGTGRLRQVVREALRQSQHVKRFETGHEGEGGDGVTVAHMESD